MDMNSKMLIVLACALLAQSQEVLGLDFARSNLEGVPGRCARTKDLEAVLRCTLGTLALARIISQCTSDRHLRTTTATEVRMQWAGLMVVIDLLDEVLELCLAEPAIVVTVSLT